MRWLADVALHRFEHFFGVDAGMAKGVRYESGAQIDMDKIICDELEEDIHVWIILKEDMALLEAESKEKQDEFE